MNYIINVVSVMAAYILLCLWGMPILAITEPRKMKAYRFATMPIIGFGAIILSLFYLFRIGIPIGRSSVISTLCIILVDLFIIFRKKISISKYDIKSIAIAATLVLVAGSFLFAPLGFFCEAISSLGHGSVDWGNYGATSAIIKKYGYADAMAGGGVTVTCFEGQTRGAIILVASISSLISLSIWNALDVALLLAFMMTVFAGCMLGHVVRNSWKAGIISGILIFFNCGYIFLIQESLLGQISSLPILISVTAYVIKYNRKHDLDTIDAKNAISIGFLAATMLFTYMEQVPFVGVVLVVALISSFIVNRQRGIICLKEYVIALAVTAGLFCKGLIVFYNVIQLVADAAVGMPVPYGGLLQALGLYNTYIGIIGAQDFVEWPYAVTIFGSIILLAILWGYILKKQTDYKRVFNLVLSIVFCILYIILVWKFRSYQTFKGLINMEFFFVVLFAGICLDGINNLREKKKYLSVLGGISVVLMSLAVLNGVDFYKRIFLQHSEAMPDTLTYNIGSFGHADTDNDELQSFLSEHTDMRLMIRMADRVDGCEAVVSAVEAGVPLDMISDKDGCFDWNVNMIVEEDKYYNIESNLVRDPIITAGNVVFQNDTFLIKEVNTDVPVCDDRGIMNVGVIQIDKDGYVTTGKNSDESYYKFNYLSTALGEFDIHLTIQASEKEKIEVTMNESLVDTISLNSGENLIQFKNIEFNKGNNILYIKNTKEKPLKKTWIKNLSVGDVGEDDMGKIKMNIVKIPNGFMGKFWNKIFKTSEIEKFIKRFAGQSGYSLGIGEAGRIADGLIINDETALQKMYFMCSNLDVVAHGSDKEYIVFCYRSILEREPSEFEVDSWVKYYDGNGSREAMLYEFLRSKEFRLHTKIDGYD